MESGRELRAIAILRDIERRLESGEDSADELPDLLRTVRLALESSRALERELRDRCQRLLVHQEMLENRLLEVERRRPFSLSGLLAEKGAAFYGRMRRLLLRSPARHLLPPPPPVVDPYTRWVNHEQAGQPAFEDQRAVVGRWFRRPLIGLVMPVFQTGDQWLREAVESVRRQSYENWRLCVAASGPQEPAILRLLEESARLDPRIRFSILPDATGVSDASNTAARTAGGEYLGFLDPDAVLSPEALYYVAESLQETEEDLIYSDEDRLDRSNKRVQPLFKPDWSPDLLLSCMYIGRFLVVRREAFDRAGGFRSEFDGACDHDLAIRVAALGGGTCHIPRVLYHRRISEGFAPVIQYSAEESRRVIEAAAAHRSAGTQITPGVVPSTYVLRRPAPAGSSVSVIICSKTARLLERCIQSVRRTVHGIACEILVVHHQDSGPDPEMERALERLGLKALPYRGPFHFSRMNNAAAEQAGAPYLLFLNDDVYAESEGWCESMIGELQTPEVGVAGALLRYPTGAIQHAGVALGIGDGAGHIGRFQKASQLWPWLTLTRDVSAVTGACLAVRASVFRELGGFDLAFPNNYNDVDFCLRAGSAGYRIVCACSAELVHDECATRAGITRLREREAFYERWAERLCRPDPFYSPSLRPTEEIALNMANAPPLLACAGA